MNAVVQLSGQGTRDVRFGDGGVLRGVVGESLTPELFTTLGVVFGAEGKAALAGRGATAGHAGPGLWARRLCRGRHGAGP